MFTPDKLRCFLSGNHAPIGECQTPTTYVILCMHDGKPPQKVGCNPLASSAAPQKQTSRIPPKIPFGQPLLPFLVGAFKSYDIAREARLLTSEFQGV